MRLIDADALNSKKKYSFQTVGLPFPKNEWFIKLVDLFAAPTIDAVPVVRCGKCIFRDELYSGDVIMCRRKMSGIVKATDFCSYGERKVTEDEG